MTLTSAEPSLGSKLKAERESRGFTLDDVSASTKIPLTLLEALERNDLSRWPKGFYGRAFFRSYLTALGLRPEPLAAEFARLFPDPPSLEPPPAMLAGVSPHVNLPNAPLALTVAEPAAEPVWRGIALALVEVAAVLAVSVLVAWARGVTLLTASGAIALIYYPFVRAAARRFTRSSNVTPRPAASIAPRAPFPSADTGEVASAKVRHTASQRIHLGLATARVRLAHLPARSAEKWVPLAKRITTTANHGLWRAGTRTRRVLSHGAEPTFQLSSRFVTWTSLLLRRAGTRTRCVVRHGAQATFQQSSRFIAWTSPVLRRAGARTWRVLRHGAEVTFQVSSRFVIWASLLLRRGGTRTGRVLRHAAAVTFQVSSRVATRTSLLLRRGGIRTGRVLRHAAAVTFQVSSRLATRTSLLLRRAGTGSRRAIHTAARHASRVSLRVLRSVNRAFWTGVRVAAEHAELFAAKRLDRNSD